MTTLSYSKLNKVLMRVGRDTESLELHSSRTPVRFGIEEEHHGCY